MKILLTHFSIQDFGGIVNYSECLAKGLRSIGHTVDAVMFKNKGKSGKQKSRGRSLDDGWQESCIADWIHQRTGWEGMFYINYRTDLQMYSDLAEQMDLIIHIIPVPTCSKRTLGDSDWLSMFGNASGFAQQIAVIHDGNMRKLYPHILRLENYLDGIVCVHDAAYNSCDVLPIRRKLIPNPHEMDATRSQLDIKDRIHGIVSLQTFKRWKRVDDLIRAIPFMEEDTKKIICGGGIEYHYMTSEDKCKKEYKTESGAKIWDVAVDHGMSYRGYVTTQERDHFLSHYKILVDPSWSKSYSQFGSHFNRVMIEAMTKGCVPVCTDLGMKNSTYFKPNVNYLEIPHDCSPSHYGRQLERWLNNDELLSKIQWNNFSLAYHFESPVVAKDLVEFAFGSSGEIGRVTEKLKNDSTKKLNHFYEI